MASIPERFVKVVGGKGGPGGNAIPVYASLKGSDGAQFEWEPGAGQAFFENDELLVTVGVISDPEIRAKFVNDRNHMQRVWKFNPATGHSLDFRPGKLTFVENTHFEDFDPADFVTGAPPVVEPPVDPVEEPVAWTAQEIGEAVMTIAAFLSDAFWQGGDRG